MAIKVQPHVHVVMAGLKLTGPLAKYLITTSVNGALHRGSPQHAFKHLLSMLSLFLTLSMITLSEVLGLDMPFCKKRFVLVLF